MFRDDKTKKINKLDIVVQNFRNWLYHFKNNTKIEVVVKHPSLTTEDFQIVNNIKQKNEQKKFYYAFGLYFYN